MKIFPSSGQLLIEENAVRGSPLQLVATTPPKEAAAPTAELLLVPIMKAGRLI